MPLPTQPVGTLERVYTALYVLDAGGEAGNDQVLYLHPNGCVHARLQCAARRPLRLLCSVPSRAGP